MTLKAVVVISGGLDSSTLAHHIAERGWDIYGLSFDYGQRHKKELEFAKHQLSVLGDCVQDHKVVKLPFFRTLFKASGSSLVTNTDVPEGHYAEESMSATVVPNRNMILTSIAVGYGVSVKADQVVLGVHAGDHFIYPDCRPGFFKALNEASHLGNQGFTSNQFGLDTPFINWTKNQIAARAVELGVDVSKTWSCYNGEDIHCGKCGTCVERMEALASVRDYEDPTPYADDQFWKEALMRETV